MAVWEHQEELIDVAVLKPFPLSEHPSTELVVLVECRASVPGQAKQLHHRTVPALPSAYFSISLLA